MWFLFVSDIERIPCWAEIPVPTGTWICHSSVPYYCAQISVPWRLQEVDTSAETLHFKPRGVLRGHEMSTFGLTWNSKSPDRNKQFISNIPRIYRFLIIAFFSILKVLKVYSDVVFMDMHLGFSAQIMHFSRTNVPLINERKIYKIYIYLLFFIFFPWQQ